MALIAAQLGGYPNPQAVITDPDEIQPIARLLANLQRPEVDLVLAAISHAAGAHDHVLHVGEPAANEQGQEWRVTATSPRLHPGPLHPWHAPALPGLTEEPAQRSGGENPTPQIQYRNLQRPLRLPVA